MIDAKSQSQVTIKGSAVFQLIWNIAYPLISLDQSTFVAEGLQLQNLSCSYPLIKQSLSTVDFTELTVQQVTGPLITNKNSELSFTNSIVQNITHNSNAYSLFTLQTTVFNVDNLTVANIISYSNQTNPIFSV